MDRRDFIKTAVAAGLVAGVNPCIAATSSPLPRRRLGRTGAELSIIGLGGIVTIGKEQAHASRSVARAVEDWGINYFDVAPSYGDGEAEAKLGPALKPYRQRSFLACKTTRRDAAGAREELERSLSRLLTDYFDLYQLHALNTLEDVEKAFAPAGAMETLVRAREEGKVRYLGFSAHGVEAALAAIQRFDFDTLLFPVNYALWTQENFGPQVVGLARERAMGILVLKAQCRGCWPEGVVRTHGPCWYEPVTELAQTRLALSFALSQGATACVPPGNEDLFWLGVTAAAQLKAMDRAAEQQLRVLQAGAIPLFRYASAE
jgi:aryl-alcohol dehydrogenase-like predicted oxidoreductase